MPLQQTLRNRIPEAARPALLEQCAQLVGARVWTFIPPNGYALLLNRLRGSLIQAGLQEFGDEIQYCIDALARRPVAEQYFFMTDVRGKEALAACLLIAQHLNNDVLKDPILTLIKNMHLHAHIDECAHNLLNVDVLNHVHGVAVAPLVINDGQSTHRTSTPSKKFLCID